MSRLRVDRLDDARLADYRQLAGPDRLAGRGLFVAESRHVLRRLIDAGRFRVRSVLLAETAERETAPWLVRLDPQVPVHVAPRALLSELAGYRVHQGCLAIAERGEPLEPAVLIRAAAEAGGRLLVLDGVANPDNVGGLFRNARAFAASGVLLVGGGDPLYRKAVRVSVGATLEVPFARVGSWPVAAEALQRDGLLRVAAVTDPAAPAVQEQAPRLAGQPLALVVGDEGQGLAPAVLAQCDTRVTVPMAAGIDSLNVAAAAGILLHHLAGLA